VSLTSSDLELVDDSGLQTVGMRFLNVTVPPGATIVNAYIQFQVDEATSVTTSLRIEGHDVDNAAVFTTASNNISSRVRTTAFQSWAPAAWNTVAAAGAPQRTPNISNVIKEIVDRPLWTGGNALVVIITGTTGKRVAEAYDGVPAAAPLLHIEYTP
jgi:hypothetical protein